MHCGSILLPAVLLVGGCATLPPNPPRTESFAMARAESGLLADTEKGLNLGPEEKAVLPLPEADEALRWRLALIDHATTTIDAQYFIWASDEVGFLLFDRLLDAADRGVRVRLLVDDIGFDAIDDSVAIVSRHPNFAIRIYNPGSVRKSTLGGLGEFLLNFRALNRRMHNKLLVVDNRFAVIGGRNIGNPYFGLSKKYNFLDLCLLFAGKPVRQMSEAFDEYWNAGPSYPGEAMSKKANFGQYPALREKVEEYLREHADTLSSYPLERKDWTGEFSGLPGRMLKARGAFLQDEPVPYGEEELRLMDMINYVAGEVDEEIILVSPYFIPSKQMLAKIAEMTARGIRVRIVTTTLGSNNHTPVHSHYKKYRRRIIAAGAELYEFRHDPSPKARAIADVDPVTAGFISLHVKAILGDRDKLFIGSLNLDPRAMVINTENGIYLESPELVGRIAAMFDLLASPENSWRVTIQEDNQLKFTSATKETNFQPARGFGQRIKSFLFWLLPIEGQL
jgi:putative cardiolipin synthase